MAIANNSRGISIRKILGFGYYGVAYQAVAGIISLLRSRDEGSAPFVALSCGHLTAFSDYLSWLELPGAVSDRARAGFSSQL